MSYVQNSLTPGERVVHSAQLHWIVLARGLTYMSATAVAAGIGYIKDNRELMGAGALLCVVSLVVFLRSLVCRLSTEFAVTNKRVIAKWGLVSRDTEEISLRRVEGVHVDQSVLGRILGYGTVVVRGVGGDRSPIVLVTAPLLFRRAITLATEEAEGGAGRDDGKGGRG